MKSTVACKSSIQCGQQHRKFVLIVIVLVAGLVAIVKQAPSVGLLDQRQMLQRTRRILPGEQEISPGAVVYGANVDSRFTFVVKIPALACHQGERPDVSPGAIGCVAVEDGRIGFGDAVNLQMVDRHPVGGNDYRRACDRDGGGDDERIGLKRGAPRSPRLCNAAPRHGSRGRRHHRVTRSRPSMGRIVKRLYRRHLRFRGRLVGRLGLCSQSRRLFDQHCQQFVGIEPRWRRHEPRRFEIRSNCDAPPISKCMRT